MQTRSNPRKAGAFRPLMLTSIEFIWMENNLYDLSEAELQEFDELYAGTIGEEQFYVLKAKLQLDEVLKHKYLVYKLLRREIENDGIASKVLKARLSALDQASKKNKKRLLVGSLLSMVAVASLILFFSNKSPESNIYDQFKDTETGLSIQMSTNSETELNPVMIAIAKSDYTNALKKLSKLRASDAISYYSAYCEERLEQDAKAERVYITLLDSKTKFIGEKSQFRLALIHLKQGKKTALNELTIIASDSTNNYKAIAKRIIHAMEKK